jgi:hypothetical protein
VVPSSPMANLLAFCSRVFHCSFVVGTFAVADEKLKRKEANNTSHRGIVVFFSSHLNCGT